MRVLYVNQTDQVSGAERSLMALLEGLDGQVRRLVACPDGELAELVAAAGVDWEPISGTRASFRLHPVHTAGGLVAMARSSLQLRRLVGRRAPDLVHANTTRAALLALLGRRRSGPPTIAHIRDWVPDGRLPRLVHRTIARRADAIVANSAYVAAQFDGFELRSPIHVIHNPVDLARFDPAIADGRAVRRELGLAESEVVLAVVGQLTPWKGQDDAIRAFAGLGERAPGVTLLLAGSAKFSGPATRYDNAEFERGLRRLADDLGVAERVRFLGERDDVPELLAATDVLLLPSWREAFGRIAIEALAIGVPVVATEVGGPAEIVREGVDGLLLPPREPQRWSEALAPLVDDRSLRRRMGEQGRERAAAFGLRAHAAAVLDLYRQLLAGGSAPAAAL